MAEYKNGSQLYLNKAIGEITCNVIQNLEDAGCDQSTVDCFVELSKSGEKQKQIKLLEKHRKSLLEKVHQNEKQIICLDYLVFQLRNEK